MKVFALFFAMTSACFAQMLPPTVTVGAYQTSGGIVMPDPALFNQNRIIYSLDKTYTKGDTLYLTVEGSIPTGSDILVCAATGKDWENNEFMPSNPIKGGHDLVTKSSTVWDYHTIVFVPNDNMSFSHITLLRQFVPVYFPSNGKDAVIMFVRLDDVRRATISVSPPFFDILGRKITKGGVPVARPQDLPTGQFCYSPAGVYINGR